MNKSQRIYFSTGDTGNQNQDKYITIKLEQEVETLEFMSMKLGTADVYQDFNSDYGVLVGRVIANGAIGIPNARISVFIPLTDEDAENSDIYSVYPYKTPRDKNKDGKRYNLLPRVSQINTETNLLTPKQPFGSFPIKEEIVSNPPFLAVYKKYYKYTALTNQSGDYMIFGLPIGTQMIHLSVDITDIGEYSMTPAAMVTNLGYSPNFFTDNNSKIKGSNDLNDLPHIETQEITVDIRPFWGDAENFEIGITRQDFRIRSVLTNTFTIFGSVFTDGDKKMWGKGGAKDQNFRAYEIYNDGAWEDVGMINKRAAKVTEKIYYYPPSISDDRINSSDLATRNAAIDEMLLLDPSEYSVYKKGGDFVVIVSCNRDKVITNEDGTQTPVDDDYAGGLFTKFKGFMTLEITEDTLNLNWTSSGDKTQLKPLRQILKFPQKADVCYSGGKPYCSHTFRFENLSGGAEDSDKWRSQYYNFCGGCIYSLSKFHSIVFNDWGENIIKCTNNTCGFGGGDYPNLGCHCKANYNAGLILTSDYSFTGNSYYGLCPNGITCSSAVNGVPFCMFGSNWLNMSVYLPQTGWVTDGYSYWCGQRSNSQFTWLAKNHTYYMEDNDQQIAGCYSNTCSFARSDINWTDFIEVPKEDILAMQNVNKKGFTAGSDCSINTISGCIPLQGTYRNGCFIPTGTAVDWVRPAPEGGGKKGGTCSCSTDCTTYFYKGYDSSDVIQYITSLGIV